MKPAVLLYLDTLPLLELLTDEEAGQLFKATLHYAAGEKPEITSPSVIKIWPFVKRRIEEDNKTYHDKVQSTRFAVYRRDHPTVSREQWEREFCEPYRSLDQIIAGEAAPEQPPPAGAEENPLLLRWIEYRGFTPEQAELMKPYFLRWEREHGRSALAAAVNKAILDGRETISFFEED